MKDFVREVCSGVGATVRDDGGALEVELPEAGVGAALAERLGGRAHRWVFDAEDLSERAELIAPGGRVLRALEEWLSERGRRTYLEAPGAERLTVGAVRERVSAASGEPVRLGARGDARGYEVYVTYRLHYRTLEAKDELETVHVRLRPWGRVEAEVVSEIPAGVWGWTARPRKQPPEAWLKEGLAGADRVVAVRAREGGRALEAEVRAKLGRDIARLHSFYSDQIAEWKRSSRTGLAELRVEELREEERARLSELYAATQVQVEVDPLQVVVVEVPLKRAEVLDPDGAPVAVAWLERTTGALVLEPPEEESAQVSPAADGCPGCGRSVARRRRCEGCGRRFCGRCFPSGEERCTLC